MVISDVIQKLILFLFFAWFTLGAFAQSDSLLIQRGIASYYGGKFHGRKTSSGELFHVDSLTAAHKILPFGTRVKVTNVKNGNPVVVRITDRLPSYSKRHIDLSLESAKRLDMIRDGLAKVRIEVMDLEEIDRLAGYFEGRERLDLRLRPYARSLPVPIRTIDLGLNKIKPHAPF